MSKETMKFIWNFFGVILCSTAVAIHITEMYIGTWDYSIYKWVLLILTSIGVIIFGTSLFKITSFALALFTIQSYKL